MDLVVEFDVGWRSVPFSPPSKLDVVPDIIALLCSGSDANSAIQINSTVPPNRVGKSKFPNSSMLLARASCPQWSNPIENLV